ncbi:MAG: PDZ domain-containing protein [Actinobacteria bacterium]|nr:PDZ domain-containing protein [Actinomycetota bacterium]
MNKKKLFKYLAALLVFVIIIFIFTGCFPFSLKWQLNPGQQDEQIEPIDTGKEQDKDQTSGLKQEKSSIQSILMEFDNAISEVADIVKPSVVNIRVKVLQQDIFGNMYEGEGVGSGTIYSSDGYIITNNHVAGSAEELIVTLFNGKEYPARLVGADKNTDIAVIKIDAGDLKPAEFTTVEGIKVGQLAIAVGSPFGLSQSVTVGVVSALGRQVPVSMDTLPMVDLIQTDAAINPGNSGGALVNSAGKVIGINTIIYSTSGSSAGVGFAIPSDTALNITKQIIKFGKARIPFMGIEMGENTTDIKGVYVKSVVRGQPAEKAGIKAGDIINEFDGRTIETPYQLLAQLLRHNVEDIVIIKIYRNGTYMEFELKLAEMAG